MSADLGGTNILDPLVEAIKSIKTIFSKKIFLLTDGQVNNRIRII